MLYKNAYVGLRVLVMVDREKGVAYRGTIVERPENQHSTRDAYRCVRVWLDDPLTGFGSGKHHCLASMDELSEIMTGYELVASHVAAYNETLREARTKALDQTPPPRRLRLRR